MDTAATFSTGGDLQLVGLQLGHESTETTQGYAAYGGKAKEAVARMYRKPEPPTAA